MHWGLHFLAIEGEQAWIFFLSLFPSIGQGSYLLMHISWVFFGRSILVTRTVGLPRCNKCLRTRVPLLTRMEHGVEPAKTGDKEFRHEKVKGAEWTDGREIGRSMEGEEKGDSQSAQDFRAGNGC